VGGRPWGAGGVGRARGCFGRVVWAAPYHQHQHPKTTTPPNPNHPKPPTHPHSTPQQTTNPPPLPHPASQMVFVFVERDSPVVSRCWRAARACRLHMSPWRTLTHFGPQLFRRSALPNIVRGISGSSSFGAHIFVAGDFTPATTTPYGLLLSTDDDRRAC